MALLEMLPSFVLGLIDPGFILYYAVEAYIQTLLIGLREDGTIPSDLRGRAFGKFWTKISGAPPDPAVALVGSATLVPSTFAQAQGTVLEIGPGSGNQTLYYNPAAAQIKTIYGAEPAKELHKLLRKNADSTRVGPKYRIIGADATKASITRELLKDKVLEPGALANNMFDAIICVRVLCSVPNLEGTISDLHAMLKPANAWRTTKGSVIARLVQTVYMLLGWSYFVGDCSLTRNIEQMLRKNTSERWETVSIERHFGKAVLTYISGSLVKKS
ncbi:hypothetical protein LTR64_006236 [Lithohypha guttulata]|uniref:uncharacterized protein n=1 Tax=Lithohypha guttulata TaxID=1690604 RepID=UPI00315D5322